MKNGSISFNKPHQERSLAESYPEVAAEWAFEKNAPLTPNDVYAASHMKVWWICKECGRAWNAAVFSRTHHGAGCPYDSCKLIPPEACMATNHPELAKEWDDKRNGNLRPDQVSPHSAMNAWWKCSKCGNGWRATVANRVQGSQCPHYNELPFLVSEAAASADKLEFVAKYLRIIIAEHQNGDFLSAEENRKIEGHLSKLWDATHMSVRDMWKLSGMTQAEFAETFAIPFRTMSDWCRDCHIPPNHVRLMMARLLGYVPSNMPAGRRG